MDKNQFIVHENVNVENLPKQQTIGAIQDTSSEAHQVIDFTDIEALKQLADYITVILDNRELVFNENDGFGIPFINEDHRIMIPLRMPLEAIGANVSYDHINGAVTAVKDTISIKVPINENTIYINGEETSIDTKAIIKDNRTYIPIRSVFEAFGYKVEWHGGSRTVIIMME